MLTSEMREQSDLVIKRSGVARYAKLQRIDIDWRISGGRFTNITLIPAWISKYVHYNVWDEITYPFPNFNGATVEV